jgi:hypothetical protein
MSNGSNPARAQVASSFFTDSQQTDLALLRKPSGQAQLDERIIVESDLLFPLPTGFEHTDLALLPSGLLERLRQSENVEPAVIAVPTPAEGLVALDLDGGATAVRPTPSKEVVHVLTNPVPDEEVTVVDPMPPMIQLAPGIYQATTPDIGSELVIRSLRRKDLTLEEIYGEAEATTRRKSAAIGQAKAAQTNAAEPAEPTLIVTRPSPGDGFWKSLRNALRRAVSNPA